MRFLMLSPSSWWWRRRGWGSFNFCLLLSGVECIWLSIRLRIIVSAQILFRQI